MEKDWECDNCEDLTPWQEFALKSSLNLAPPDKLKEEKERLQTVALALHNSLVHADFELIDNLNPGLDQTTDPLTLKVVEGVRSHSELK